MAADFRRLAELGMIPSLAKEVAAAINAGVVSAIAVRRLTENSMTPREIRELRAQLANPAMRMAKRWTEIGVSPRLARELVSQVGGGVAPVITLNALGLSNSNFTIGTPSNASITNATSGSSISSSNLPTGFTINSAARQLVYSGAGSAATTAITLTETLAGATNSPRANSLSVNVAAASGPTALPQQSAIATRWSADDMPVQADGTSVSSWTDSVGGLAATNATAGATQPLYKTNQFGTKPGVQMTASAAQFLSAARADAAATGINAAFSGLKYSVLIVHKSLAGAATNGLLFATSSQGFVSDGTKIGRNSRNPQLLTYTPTGITTLGYTTTNTSPIGGASGLQRTYVNGGCIGCEASAGPQGGTGDYGIGAFYSGTATFQRNSCVIADIIIWNKELTPVEMLQAEKWARDKYGLPYPWAGLPSFTVFSGSSQWVGFAGTSADTGPQTRSAVALGLTPGQYSTIAIAGATIQVLDARAPTELDPTAALIGIPVRHSFMEGFNTIKASSGSAAATALGTYLTNRRSANTGKVAICTITDTTDTTVSNQRPAYLTGVLALSSTLYDALVRVDLNANVGVAGSASNTTYFNADGIHQTDAGYQEIANIVAPPLGTL